MVYSFEFIQRANIRYRDEALTLARCELFLMLRSLNISVSEIQAEQLGDMPFLSFEAPELSPEQLCFLRGHSSLSLLAIREGSLLRPLAAPSPDYLPEDLPEVLKYKGKTSVSFTRMMINMAFSLSAFSRSREPLILLDPLCGKGTTLFCALQRGMNAVGLDADRKAVHEAADYLERYLKWHQLKHARSAQSETLPGGSLPVTAFVLADSREHYQAGDTRFLKLAVGDTASAPALLRKKQAHLIAADLPYGIQHAPQAGQRPESFRSLLHRVLPAWKKALRPGGVLVLSFNMLTLPADQVVAAMEEAGLTPCLEEPLMHLRHPVEQAVVRDVRFATLNEGGIL